MHALIVIKTPFGYKLISQEKSFISPYCFENMGMDHIFPYVRACLILLSKWHIQTYHMLRKKVQTNEVYLPCLLIEIMLFKNL